MAGRPIFSPGVGTKESDKIAIRFQNRSWADTGPGTEEPCRMRNAGATGVAWPAKSNNAIVDLRSGGATSTDRYTRDEVRLSAETCAVRHRFKSSHQTSAWGRHRWQATGGGVRVRLHRNGASWPLPISWRTTMKGSLVCARDGVLITPSRGKSQVTGSTKAASRSLDTIGSSSQHRDEVPTIRCAGTSSEDH